MNNLREALEETTATICRLCKEKYPWHKDCTSCQEIEGYRQALESADTWSEPDETVHPHAPLWFTYPGAGGWFPSCNSERENINSMFRGAVFVLAKENQGPPPDDWKGEDK